jgi:predicted HTH transcriptional regulator
MNYSSEQKPVLLLSSDEHRKAAGGQVALSERQMRVIEFIHTNGSVKSSDLVAMFRISRQAALKELTALGEKGLLQREGDRRGARYILK